MAASLIRGVSPPEGSTEREERVSTWAVRFSTSRVCTTSCGDIRSEMHVSMSALRSASCCSRSGREMERRIEAQGLVSAREERADEPLENDKGRRVVAERR
eukprot:5218488-Pleurochrysis_carterae.AAC.1